MAEFIKMRRVPITENAIIHLSLQTTKKPDVFNVFDEYNGREIGNFHKSRLLGAFSEQQLAYVRKHGSANFTRTKKNCL